MLGTTRSPLSTVSLRLGPDTLLIRSTTWACFMRVTSVSSTLTKTSPSIRPPLYAGVVRPSTFSTLSNEIIRNDSSCYWTNCQLFTEDTIFTLSINDDSSGLSSWLQFTCDNELFTLEQCLGVLLSETGVVHKTSNILDLQVGEDGAGDLSVEVLQLKSG